MNKETKDYLEFAIKTAEKAGKTLLAEFTRGETIARGTSKEIKSLHDLISDGIIKKEIEKHYPTHSFITEETGMVEKSDHSHLWIIDPLDGTGNFVNSNPLFAVSIALWVDGEPLVAVIHAPALGEQFVAVRGEGSTVHNIKRRKTKKAAVSTVESLRQAYAVYCEGGSTDKVSQLKFYNQLYPQLKDMRKMGSAALELAWVGVGRSDLYVTPEINIWDIAAGVLFVKEAGGTVYNFSIQPYHFPNMLNSEKINVLATNGKLTVPPISYA